MEFINHVAHALPVGFWWATAGPLVLSTILMWISNRVNGTGGEKALSDKAMMSLTVLFGFLGAGLEYCIRWFGDNPSQLGSKTTLAIGVMTLCYRYIVKPVNTILQDAKAQRQAASDVGKAPAEAAAPAPDYIAPPVPGVGVIPAAQPAALPAGTGQVDF